MSVPLPFEPETEDQVLQRFPQALFPFVAMDEVLAGQLPRPGTLRRHVFDFHDGMRMIASTDYDRTHCYVHLSFSSYGAVKDMADYLQFHTRMQERVRWLAGNPSIMPASFETTPAAVHLYFRTLDFAKYVPSQEITVAE